MASYRFEGGKWPRTAIDVTLAPRDLRVGDLDGDGAPDLVAVGSGGEAPHVVWYRTVRPRPEAAPR